MNENKFTDASLRSLIRFFEQVYRQNVAMKRILDSAPGLAWKTKLLERLRDIEDEGRVTETFEKLYESLDNPATLHGVIQEFLNVKHAG